MERPLFRDYARQLFGVVFLKKPIASQNRHYTLIDRPMLFLIQIPIVLAVLFLYNYSPLSTDHYAIWAERDAFWFGVMLLTSYWFFFVYRFARFGIEWEDTSLHPGEAAADGQDAMGYILDTPENRKNARKSRGIFALLAVALAAITTVYCFVTLGLAPWRLYGFHTESLNRLAEIADDSLCLYIYPSGKFNREMYVNGEMLPAEDSEGSLVSEDLPANTVQEIRDIVNEFHNGYISYIIYNHDQTYLYIGLNARWGPGCDLIWSPDDVSVGTIQNQFQDSAYQNVRITKLDAHWWMVWSDYVI